MSKKLGLLSCLAYSIGGMVGSSIFVAPTSVLLHSGSSGLSLLLWIGGALVSAIGALVYIELGTCIPETGGGFAYQMHAKWHCIAVPFYWLGALFTSPMILAIQTTALGQLIVQTLKHWILMSSTTTFILERITGFSALLLILVMNMFSLDRYAARFQIIFTFIKLLVVIGIISIGLFYIINYGPSETLKHPFQNTTSEPLEVIFGLYASFFCYTGWEALNTAVGEIENPNLVLPIACLGGIFVVCVVAILMNVAYFSVINTHDFVESSAIAVLFSERTMGHISFLAPLIIAILMMSNINTTLFATSRYMYAGAIKGALPTGFACRARDLTPRVSLIAQGILAMSLSFIGDLDQLISYMSYAEFMDRLSVQFALIYMRLNKKDFVFASNAYQNPIIIPFLYMTICLLLLAIPLYQNYRIALFGLSMIGLSLIAYIIFFWLNFRLKFFNTIDDAFCRFVSYFLNVDYIEEAKKDDINDRSSTISSDCIIKF